MSITFGTGGWRAVIGDDFTRQNVQKLAFALAQKFLAENHPGKGVVIGYDRRFLSREAAGWAAETLAGAGVYCQLIDRESPTPLVMYAVRQAGYPYGLAVTASHNPAIYNGIKVFIEGGRDADEEVTNELEGYLARQQGQPPVLALDAAVRQGLVAITDPMNAYIDSILAAVDCAAIRRRGLRVALDPMYGVSKTALQTILLTARCEVSVIHERHDTLFGGRLPAPNQKTLAGLMNYVEENHCDIGIATDGDADRLGVIDDQASFLHPNRILSLLYYYLVKYKGWHGAAVRNLATTHLLDAIAGHFGERCYEVPVGFKYISGKMLATGAIIGGESSGGLTVRGHIQGKDGIYAAALLIEMIAVTGRSLSALWAEIEQEFGRYEMYESDFKFSHEKKAAIHKTLMEDKLLPDFAQEIDRVSYLDGCKVYFRDGGWVIARFSGTEPLLRIFCEQNTMDKAEKTAKTLQHFLEL